MNVTAIEEARELSSIKFEELIGSLQTFKIFITDRYEKKNKNIVFISKYEEDEDQSENLSDAITIIGKKLNTSLRSLDKQCRTNGQDKRSYISS